MIDNKIDVLGVKFSKVNMKQAVEEVKEMLKTDSLKMIFTPNPEIVMLAQEDPEFMDILNNANLLVADGIGVVKAAKILGTPLEERVAGYDLVQHTLEYLAQTNKTAFFFGAAPGVAELAAEEMMNKYPGLKVLGTRDGYFTEKDEENIINQINNLKPDLLLVGLGAPKQEKWIYNNSQKLNAKICIGVGGSFDGMSGKVKRAPEVFIKLNLEWFYRLLKQPTRIKRMIQLPIFLIRVSRKKKEVTNGTN